MSLLIFKKQSCFPNVKNFTTFQQQDFVSIFIYNIVKWTECINVFEVLKNLSVHKNIWISSYANKDLALSFHEALHTDEHRYYVIWVIYMQICNQSLMSDNYVLIAPFSYFNTEKQQFLQMFYLMHRTWFLTTLLAKRCCEDQKLNVLCHILLWG